MLKRFTRAEKGWIMYDWANSAFSAIIAAIILPSFYTQLTEGNIVAGTWWGYATSIATLVCAVLAPFLGTLGDYQGTRSVFSRLSPSSASQQPLRLPSLLTGRSC